MKEVVTFFEQVPKAKVEEILAQQTASSENGVVEKGQVAGPDAGRAVAPSLGSLELERSLIRQRGRVSRANKERA